MLKTLALHRYRGFESYRLTELARVNLLVGKNNCGKTSILEAAELLVSGGRPTALYESAVRRAEVVEREMGYGPDISHVFYGHRYAPGTSFELSCAGSQQHLTATILSLDEVGEEADRWDTTTKRRRRLDPDEEFEPAFGLRIVRDGQQPIVLPVSENGTILHRFWTGSMRNGLSHGAVRFLNFDPSSMRAAWNAVLAEGGEAEIVQAMRLLMPEIDSIHFLASDGRQRGGILVGRQDGDRRLPIGSYGEGMRRLLAVSLALVGTKNGCLLIDEIDTGFHWTVMEDMWRLVVEAAQRSSVQVFATTHSFDCIRGLGALVRSRPDLAEQVAIQKVHPSLEQAVCIPGEEIGIAVEQDIEVR